MKQRQGSVDLRRRKEAFLVSLQVQALDVLGGSKSQAALEAPGSAIEIVAME